MLSRYCLYNCTLHRYNEWVHVNCALWSSEVYETVDGSLQNIPQVSTNIYFRNLMEIPVY